MVAYHSQAKDNEVEVLLEEGVPQFEMHEDIATYCRIKTGFVYLTEYFQANVRKNADFLACV